ncbi:MAG: DUF6713 family protein [Bacteroidota bacterium]
MVDHLFFYWGLGLLLTHEMDAVRCREWKLFIILSGLKEPTAYRLFTALHIPLYGFLLQELVQGPATALVIGLDAFFVIHVVLHFLFSRHPANGFTSWFSWLLIIGAGLCGLLDLAFYLSR